MCISAASPARFFSVSACAFVPIDDIREFCPQEFIHISTGNVENYSEIKERKFYENSLSN
jgi:hypothetical protein